MKADVQRERHPIRSLLKLAFLAGVVMTVGRYVARKKEEYAGLTESQARDRLMEKMAPKVGDDTASDIADQVIPKLRERGIVKADPIDEVDGVAEAADSVVKD